MKSVPYKYPTPYLMEMPSRSSPSCSYFSAMIHNIIKTITSCDGDKKKIQGKVVLMKKNVLDFNDFNASILDRVHELLGQRVSLQLISAVNGDPSGLFFSFPLFTFTSPLLLSTSFLHYMFSVLSTLLLLMAILQNSKDVGKNPPKRCHLWV